VLLDFAHPIFNSSEGLSVSDVVGNDDTVSSFIVTRSNGLESVLSCCVPDLEFNSLSVDIDGSDFEVDSDSWHELFLEDIVSESH
jgi:hypothetical protein